MSDLRSPKAFGASPAPRVSGPGIFLRYVLPIGVKQAIGRLAAAVGAAMDGKTAREPHSTNSSNPSKW
jgi:hypothetical protein